MLHYFAHVSDSIIDFYWKFWELQFRHIYRTVYCRRIHYHSFESCWVFLSKYQKIMASLPFTFCWRKQILLTLIQNFFFLFDCHNVLKNSLINTKMSQDLFQPTLNIFHLFLKIWRCDIKWDWMMPHDVFFLKSIKNCLLQQKYYMRCSSI